MSKHFPSLFLIKHPGRLRAEIALELDAELWKLQFDVKHEFEFHFVIKVSVQDIFMVNKNFTKLPDSVSCLS